MKNNCLNNVCCYLSLSSAVRFISFVGLLISVLLITVLLNDRSADDFAASRLIALALGLDWSHFHSNASTSKNDDPRGRMISILMIFYSLLFLLTNICLLLAVIVEKRILTIPWLFCEFMGCLSKMGALIFHIISDSDNLSNTFIYGSLLYIAIITWWWLTVYAAQDLWKRQSKPPFALSFVSIIGRDDTGLNDSTRSSQKKNQLQMQDLSSVESPIPYLPNECYKVI